jgi:pilus assembly protein CpaF
MFSNRPAMNRDNRPKMTGSGEDNASASTLEGIKEEVQLIRDSIQKRLLSDTNVDLSMDNAQSLKKTIEVYFNELLVDQNLLYNRAVRTEILAFVTADIIGYGPLEPLLEDPFVTEIMVNRHDLIYVERYGIVETTNVQFNDEAHLRRIIDRIVAPIGRRVDESSPMVDARLPSGFRVNATIPPISLDGPTLTIRKFAVRPFTAQDLITNGSVSLQMITFLKACVEARINLVISGGTGTGKTSLLNVISSFIPAEERIITIEDIAELKLNQRHIVRLEKRPPNIEGRGEVAIRQILINALRMRPDRIVVGECRGGEALDMLQAMNTGHNGSMTTVHANTPRDALGRIETMVLMAGIDLPLKAIREQVASSIELIVHIERLKDGSRKVVKITEVQNMEGDTIVLQDLFVFTVTGMKTGRVEGTTRATGLRPQFAHKFEASGVEILDSIYET